MEKLLKKYKHEFILAILICVYIAYFTLASFLRYDNFYTGRFDLGNMDQAVWNTINGRIFQGSTADGFISSRLSGHADFLLILLSPFYLIWSHPKMLLLIQSVTLGLGGIFVFLIAKDILKNKHLALAFGFLYLMNPAMQFANLYDFHAVTIATTTLLASFYFMLRQKYLAMTVFLILSGLAKEQVWITTSIFGLYLLFNTKKTKIFSIGITFFSLFIFGYLIWFAIPQNSNSQHFALSYYSDFGNSPGDVIKNVLFSPQKVIGILLGKSQLVYLKQLFIPLGFFSLLSPLYLLFAVPDLLIKLISSNPQLHQIYYQYSSAITPFIFISGIYGISQFTKWFPRLSKFYIILYLIVMTFLSAYFFGPLPGAKKPNLDMFAKPQKNKVIIEDFLSTIPEQYSIAATNNLGSHLSQRQQLSTIPDGIDRADFVLFLFSDSQKVILENVKKDKNYVQIFEKDNFVVFKKQGILL